MTTSKAGNLQAKKRLPNKGSFVKGDKRINREGRKTPKDVKELNALLDEIFAEEVTDERGRSMGKLRVALNKMLLGKNIAGAIHLLERRYGKVTEKHEHNINAKISWSDFINAGDDPEADRK